MNNFQDKSTIPEKFSYGLKFLGYLAQELKKMTDVISFSESLYLVIYTISGKFFPVKVSNFCHARNPILRHIYGFHFYIARRSVSYKIFNSS